MSNHKTVFAFLILTICLINCKNQTTQSESPKAKPSNHIGQSLNYDLDNPLNNFSLSRDLQEISGLTYSSAFDKLLAINDEKGYVYLLDPLTAKIQDRINFGKSNDYEGIAYKDGMIYVVESNGDISVIDEKSEKRIDKFKTKLSRRNDIEGLSYNIVTSNFLVAAKGSGNIGSKSGKQKSIFSLDPISKAINETPIISIDLKQAIDALNESSTQNKALLTNYQKIRINKFSPSGIAVHPITNDIYVLS